MRDPEARLHFEGSRAVRRVREPLVGKHFLRSELAARWVGQGRLLPFELEGDLEVAGPRLPFVSHPYEWCDAQLHRAAELTLALQAEAVAEGYDLKDASAWNILFTGTRPVFCDLMSFVPLHERKWWAMGQFARHFILPLVVSERRGLRSHRAFMMWRDGMPSEVARAMLGPRRYLTRYWPLMAGGPVEGAALAAAGSVKGDQAVDVAVFRQRLHASTAWMIEGCRSPGRSVAAEQGAWAGYTAQRAHYADESLRSKQARVDGLLKLVAPRWVLDLGCNTGEFSRMALDRGAEVVAIDADHDAIQRGFVDTGPERCGLHLLVASLDDMAGGRGWAGSEHAGLAVRLEQRFDLVLMLALIHHLAVGASIPLAEVAAFAARCTTKWLIVEWLDEADPQLRSLCAQRQRSASDFSLVRQREAFRAEGFIVEAEASLAPAHRTLALLRRTV